MRRLSPEVHPLPFYMPFLTEKVPILYTKFRTHCILITAVNTPSLKYEYTVDSLLTDTSVKRTLRVGPCLSLLPLFVSL